MGGQQRVYGNNQVFWGGRLIGGPDVRSCMASLFMILLPSILWHVEVGSYFLSRYTMALPVVAGLLQVSSMVLLLATAFSDPGIVPRQKNFTEQYDEKTKSLRQRQPPRYYDIILRGHPFRLKYCVTCNIYRPPRCTHCSVCENCIERFDHHCPWIGNCVGKRNYWLFYSFVTATGALNVLVLASSLAQLSLLYQEFKDEDGQSTGVALVEAVKKAPLATVLAGYCAAIVWFTVGLCLYHNFLISMNQTTYEQIKGAYGNFGSGTNPFHRGVFGNYREILCGPVRRRYFDADTGELRWPTVAAAGAHKVGDDTKPLPPMADPLPETPTEKAPWPEQPQPRRPQTSQTSSTRASSRSEAGSVAPTPAALGARCEVGDRHVN